MSDDEQQKRLDKMHAARRANARQRREERTGKVCPDCCSLEGNCEPQPLDEFWTVAANGYIDNERLSAYCRRHQRARNTEYMSNALNPESPQYNADLHERQKQAKRAYAKKSYVPKKGPDHISMREAGDLLGVSAQTISNWQKSGKLPDPLTRTAVQELAQARNQSDGSQDT